MKKFFAVLLIGLLCLLALSMQPPPDPEDEAIRAAVADYVEAIYEVQPERIERSVDVTLRKYGYWRPDDSNEYRQGGEMNFKQLVNLAARWNTEGRVDPATGQKEITVLDRLDKTASAKLIAYWGIDYFHLAKEGGKWKIINVIWQSHPPAE